MPIASIHHASSKENQTLDLFVGTLSEETKDTIQKLKDKGMKFEVRDHNGGK
jgi:hypothetical protein